MQLCIHVGVILYSHSTAQYTDWTDFHVGYQLYGVKEGDKSLRLLDIGSHTLPETTSSYLGELKGIVLAMKKTRSIRGHVSTRVLSDNRAVMEKLAAGTLIEEDVRVCRCLEYLLHNEPNATYEFIPGTENRGADLLSRMRKKKERIEDHICANEDLTSQEIKRRIEHAHFGHWSADVTLQNARMEYGSWPRMRQHIEEYIKTCPNCAFPRAVQIRDGPNKEVMTELGQRVYIVDCGFAPSVGRRESQKA